jgi:hypothetical protein
MPNEKLFAFYLLLFGWMVTAVATLIWLGFWAAVAVSGFIAVLYACASIVEVAVREVGIAIVANLRTFGAGGAT